MGIEKDTIARVLTEFTQLREAAAACHAWGGQNLQMIDAGLQQAASRLKTILARQTADADRDLQQTLATAAQMFDASVNREVRQEIDRATRHLGPLASPWSDPAWQRYQPGDITSGQPNFPGALRVGTLAWGSGSHAGMAPAMLPLIGARSALIHGSAATHDRAVEALQSVSTRLVSVFPPGHYRLTLIDSGGVGQNLKHFLRLPSQVRRDKIYSESREIEAELKRLLHHVETVTQSRLLDVATIEEYNARIGEVSVPYQFLIVVDFPAGFTETSLPQRCSASRRMARARAPMSWLRSIFACPCPVPLTTRHSKRPARC